MVLLAMLYVMFVLKESVSRHAKDRPKDAIIVKLDKGFDIMVIFIKSNQVSFFLDCCKNFLQLSLSGFRTLFKKRPEGARRWILCFTAVFCMSKAIDSGAGSVIYMFYRIQYNLTDTNYSSLSSLYTILMLVCQVTTVGRSLTSHLTPLHV